MKEYKAGIENTLHLVC